MRELRLKYFIDLVSNIQAKAKSDAEAITQSQAKIQAELSKTGSGLGAYERMMLRAGGVQNAGLQRQAQYFTAIAQNALRAQQNVARYAETAAKVKNGLQGVATGAGAVAAAGYVAVKALEKPVDYDTRLRKATTTAFAGQDINGLRAGYQELGELIKTTVRTVSGASRDSTLDAYEKLVGIGAFSKAESAQLLPNIMKTSVASGADAGDLVKSADKLKTGELKLKTEDIPLALAKIMRAGQEGGFEIKDSAKFMGPLIPLMKGYKGMAGVESLVTMLQQVRSTAGNNDEAANNLKNFLQKIPADSTRRDFKKQGIDLDKELVNGALKGMTPVDTYMAALDKVMAKQDPEGKARAAMVNADKSASPEEKKDQYDRIAEIYKSAGISKIINDIQEFGGYSGLAGTKDYGAKTLSAVRSETGSAVSTGYQFMTEGTGAKMTDVANRKDIAASDALEGKSGVLNKALDGAIALADKFPGLASAAYSSSVALGVLTGAAGAAALLGGGKGGKTGWLAGAAGKVAALYGARAAGAAALSTVGATGAGAAAPLVGPMLPAAAAAAAPLGAAALGGTMAAGLAVVGAPILGAGVVMSNRANSASGLRERITDRDARISELDQLMAGGGSQASLQKMATQKAALQRDRDAMQVRLQGIQPAAATDPVTSAAPVIPAVAATVTPSAAAPIATPVPGTTAIPVIAAAAAVSPPEAPSSVRPAKPAAAPVPPAPTNKAPKAASAPPAAIETLLPDQPRPAPKAAGILAAPLLPAPLRPEFARDAMMRAMPPVQTGLAAPKSQLAGLDFVSLTAPGAPAQNLQPGGRTEVKVGEGLLNVRVTVQDDRVQVAQEVAQQPSLIKISAGATNPGGFR